MMNSYNQEDIKLLQQARRRVRLSMVGVTVLVVVYFIILALIFSWGPLLEFGDISMPLLASASIQTALLIGLCMVFNTEKPKTRILWWIFVVLEFLHSAGLVYMTIFALSGFLPWLIWSLCSLVKLYGLFQYGKWLQTSYWAKIFFDKTLVVYKTDPQMAARPTLQPSSMPGHAEQKAVPDFASENEGEITRKIKRVMLSYPQMALRLAAFVYGELIFFPALCELLKFWMSSTDGKYTFAPAYMFTLCIFSAVIWTVPVFFLYLRQPLSKAAVSVCIALEAIMTIRVLFVLYGYMHQETIYYNFSNVAVFFAIDMLRYFILFKALQPLYTIPVPKQAFEPEDIYEGEEDDDEYGYEDEDAAKNEDYDPMEQHVSHPVNSSKTEDTIISVKIDQSGSDQTTRDSLSVQKASQTAPSGSNPKAAAPNSSGVHASSGPVEIDSLNIRLRNPAKNSMHAFFHPEEEEDGHTKIYTPDSSGSDKKS